jgi:hypothetical protein
MRTLWLVFLFSCLAAAQSSLPAETREEHASVAIVVDSSAMEPAQWQSLVTSVDAFLAAFNGQDDEVALFAAGDQPQKLEDFTSDARRVSAKLHNITPQGSAATYNAIPAATDYVQREASHNRTALVAFIANRDARGKVPEKSKIAVDVIALPGSDWRDQQGWQKLAGTSGGVAYFPSGESQLNEAATVLGRNLAAGDTQLTADPQLNRKRPLSGYRRVLVHKVRMGPDKGVDAPHGNDSILHGQILARLRESHLFGEVVDASNEEAFTHPTANDPDTLSLLPTLREYKQGSRAQRQFIGWKGGAKYRLQLSFFDSRTHQPVGAFMETGESSSGVFGGSDQAVHAKAMHRVLDKLMDDLKRAK